MNHSGSYLKCFVGLFFSSKLHECEALQFPRRFKLGQRHVGDLAIFGENFLDVLVFSIRGELLLRRERKLGLIETEGKDSISVKQGRCGGRIAQMARYLV